MQKLQLILLLVALVKCTTSENFVPVVMWHGMGDSCCFPFSLGAIKKMIEAQLDNKVYVKSLEIGGSYIRDYESGYFIHPNIQVEDACNQIKNDPKLKDGYNAIGFSQGSQFLRALVQRCPEPAMKNLITLGGQHQGIYGLPNCPSVTTKTCNYFREILNFGAYTSFVQNFLVQATYWHDPLNEGVYQKQSTFLAEINNEHVKNETYIKNLQSLKRLIMVKFLNDTIVDPVETQWFGFYKSGQERDVETLESSRLFLNDQLGLKQMKADNKIVYLATEGNHLQFTKVWFIEHILPFLKEP